MVLIGGSYIGCEVAASLTAMGADVHDRDDRGGGALAHLRRGGRALLPRPARRARGRGARRRGARGVRGRRAGRGGGHRERAHGRGRHGRRRRRGAARHDARRARRARGRRRDRLRREARDARRRGSSPPATSAPTTASSTAGGCGSSTGTWPCSRAATPPRAMLGSEEPYREIPYFFSDLADWASLEYVGPAYEWDEVVWRGDPDAGEFSAWYLRRRRGQGRARRRALRGPDPRPHPDRDRGGHLGPEGRSSPTPTPSSSASGDRRPRRYFVRGSRPAMRPGVTAARLASGPGSWGSNPWAAALLKRLATGGFRDETGRPYVFIPASGIYAFVTLSTPWTFISAGAWSR